MADDVASVLADSGYPSADVFGISLGGMIAQEMASRHPHRVRRLVLANTASGGRAARRVQPCGALALARGATLSFEEAIRSTAPWVLSAGFLTRRPDIVEVWITIASSEPRRRLGVWGQVGAAACHDASRRVRHIHHPTLVLTSDGDRLVPPENGRWLANAIPNATLRVVRGAGHDLPTEHPTETAALVLEFLSREDHDLQRGSSKTAVVSGDA